MKISIRSFISSLLTIILYSSTYCQIAGSKEITIPEYVSIDILADLYEPVEFDHQLHVDYASCAECHHHTTGSHPSNPFCLNCHDEQTSGEKISCTRCHLVSLPDNQEKKPASPEIKYHIDVPGLKAAYHLSCLICHETIGTGPTNCDDCHELTQKGEKFFKTDIKSKTEITKSTP